MIKYYDIQYQKKWWVLKEFVSLSWEDLDMYMQGFNNCAVVFWDEWEVVRWIDDVEIFRIIEKDYFKKIDEDEYEIHVYGDDWSIVEVDVKDGNKKDVTNEKLIEYNIRSWYYERIWNVILEWRKLYVDNKFISKLDEERKPIELIRLILQTAYKEKFTYDELKKAYDNSQIVFQELTKADLNETSIREIIGKKVKASKDIANIEFIEISSNFISLWKEKES